MRRIVKNIKEKDLEKIWKLVELAKEDLLESNYNLPYIGATGKLTKIKDTYFIISRNMGEVRLYGGDTIESVRVK